MKLFDSVVIGCDNSAYSFQAANAIRTTLESFGLRVHLYDLAIISGCNLKRRKCDKAVFVRLQPVPLTTHVKDRHIECCSCL